MCVLFLRVSSPRIFCAPARPSSRRKFPEALEAYLEAYHADLASEMKAGETVVERRHEVEEICGVLVNYGPGVGV